MVYFQVLAYHLLGLPTPRLKSLPCLNTLSLVFIGLLCGEQSEIELSNNINLYYFFLEIYLSDFGSRVMLTSQNELNIPRVFIFYRMD